MELDRTHCPDTTPAPDVSGLGSLVDCLFEMMPEEGVVKSRSAATSAVSAGIEARLASRIRTTIASRLREDAA